MFLRPPAVDHAKDGWLFPASAVMLEALLWGFPSVFGVFQDYYTTHPPFAGSQSTAVIGTCAMATMYLGMSVIYVYMPEWFDKMLSLAYGIVLVSHSERCLPFLQHTPIDPEAGSALAGVVLPPLVQWLLYAYGYQTTLRVCAIFIFLLAVPMLFFFKPRLLASQYSKSNG
ncbi:hypothetical protein DPSP01_009526 [Paraphaeosphaeria sporulosa]